VVIFVIFSFLLSIIACDKPALGQIAFASERNVDDEIYVMNADSSDQKRLTNNSADDISPVGSR
jgi:hypothetical protein